MDGVTIVDRRFNAFVLPNAPLKKLADGFRCDEQDNLWSSAGDGVHCISRSAELLGKIAMPFVVSNLCFGGRHYSRPFICGSHTLYAMYVNQRGAQRP